MRISTAIGSIPGAIRRGYVCVILCSVAFSSCSRADTSLVPTGPLNGGTAALNALGSEASFAGQPNANHGYKLLYAFDKGKGLDGSYPDAGLTEMAGELYGTTSVGGGTPCISGFGCGTVFKVSTSGKESVLYRFKGSPDGSGPVDSLIVMNGALYGTTSEGGAGSGCNTPSGNCGTVFKVTASGKETVLYTFKGGTDGSEPWGPLLAVKGTLYGTTVGGGATGYGYGTVFSLTTSGKETVLHTFGDNPDGAYPYGGLIALDGELYGTTYEGGPGGYGSVFKISTSGNEQVIYGFLGNGDGAEPQASLVAMNGELYGTTVGGGANAIGTVFQVSTSGQESVLYSFAGTTNAWPISALIASKGELYGTTLYGGSFICGTVSKHYGCGTVFKLSASGKESVLHNFRNTPDGSYPGGSLLAVNGTLYGTTEDGGRPNVKHSVTNLGSVFEVSP
jgi:uncharacterized repeat protein (TIGR03803 family)